MTALVTGATGLVGLNVVNQLAKRGEKVRVLARPASRGIEHVKKFGADVVNGDVTDFDSVKRAMRGARHVYHVAGVVGGKWQEKQMWAVNVKGTENVARAALEENVEGFVHTSSTAAVATGTLDRPATEETPYDLDVVKSPYHTTKRKGEEAVLAMAKQGLPARVVNPSTMFGPWDVKPTSGLILQIAAKRGIPFYPTGANNFIDVEDAALGHLLAMERGKAGQRYILGNENMTWKRFLTLVAEVAGKRPPRTKLLKPVALGVAYLLAPVSRRSSGALAWLDPATIRGAFAHHCVDPSKARRELGLPASPVRGAVEKEFRWLKQHGYLN